ncbi:MAG: HEAT repeat domain-containing protein [Deltaproteobacteria bacterium]|nr:HEAT repeat domain-containing protein [Deltaproteobacteria bacterium]
MKAASARALERIGSPIALPVLKKYADHPDPNVRGAVEKAIEALAC